MRRIKLLFRARSNSASMRRRAVKAVFNIRLGGKYPRQIHVGYIRHGSKLDNATLDRLEATAKIKIQQLGLNETIAIDRDHAIKAWEEWLADRKKPDPKQVRVGARIRDLRYRRAFTQKTLAHISGLTVKTVRRAERGLSISPDSLICLASSLRVRPQDLYQVAD